MSAASIPFIQLKKANERETRPPQVDYEHSLASDRAAARFSLEGKTAIVTGGAGGLGFEAANALLEHGVSRLAIFDANETRSAEAAGVLSERYPSSKVVYRIVSVTDEEIVKLAVEGTAEEFSKIDILLCFAGVVGVKPSLEQSAADWKRVMDVNAMGTFICAKAVAKTMVERQTRGSIVLIASMSGTVVNYPQPQVAYNASKAAVLHTARSLAAEWACFGIRVNSISPGYMDTILNEGTALDTAREMWISRTPLGRLGRRDELNGAIILLCSPAGSFICGSDIKIDGGCTILA